MDSAHDQLVLLLLSCGDVTHYDREHGVGVKLLTSWWPGRRKEEKKEEWGEEEEEEEKEKKEEERKCMGTNVPFKSMLLWPNFSHWAPPQSSFWSPSSAH